MNTAWYDYIPDSDGDIFYFASSEDSKIDKIVVFTQMNDPDSYAVVLGNLRDDGSIDVDERGDNGDTTAVLSTVSKAIAFFLSDRPEASVVIEASTSARARLYQMAILRESVDLGQYFDIYGFNGRCKEIFQPGQNYLSFIISIKTR
ncbi:hypothetical protein SAMN05216327_101142 [Dyadobacter sp. SG02]|uniref:DUF6934 family protein n=1 Tax=Dyadobacter sp. SG02 TaxID=1855291 RepID=UPI0008BA3002|nr:hypothetical protein [Dyadobacter sp. SG02]SEI38829.1 hypothetical protein SAMN05216327_101142 [Dyadobacter sp. SG02]